VRFIALLSPFDRLQGLVCGEKARSSRLKSHLDSAAWVLPGEINAMENCAGCNEGLATQSGEVAVSFIALLSPFGRSQGLVCGEKAGSSRLKCHLDSAVWVLPGKVNTMENCTGCYEGLATLSGEVDVRFIALLSLFDRAQGLVCGEKARSSRLKSHLDSAAWVLPGEINAMENCTGCYEGLPHYRVRSRCASSHSSVPFAAHKASFVEKRPDQVA